MREIQTSLLPFHLHKKTISIPEGITIEQIVKFVMPRKIKGVDVIVSIGDTIVPVHLWKILRPKISALVNVSIIPAGGGGGGGGAKSVIGVIAAIAIVITAPYLASAAVGALGLTAGTFAASAVYTSVILSAGLVASLTVSMLSSTPKQNGRNFGSGSPSESTTQFIEGASNAINRYGVIPVNLGVNRMFPLQAALPYSETLSNEQYSRQLFTYGYGSLEISELKIGETDLAEYDSVTLQHKLAGDLHTGVSLYPNDVFQENFSILLEEVEGFVTRTTQPKINEFTYDITFPQGLCRIDDSGTRFTVNIEFEVQYKEVSDVVWISIPNLTMWGATFEPVRYSGRIYDLAEGQYDFRIKRITADSTSDRIRDLAYLTGIRSISYGSPVLKQDLSGTAMRILATDQLNGTVDRYNAIVSTIVTYYDSVNDVWVEGVSSNPAALYRYVLQSPAFVKNLPDGRINIDKLEEWSIFCDEKNLTYNRVIDYDTSIDGLLNDIAAAGMATVDKVHGVYGVIIDNERPFIKGMVTPRNSWGYKGSINYVEMPHALRVEFRNPDIGYETDERIVYNDGYDVSNAALFESLQFASCTNPDLAYFYGRSYFANGILQPEIHNFNMDFESLSFNRGDRIVLVNDSILVGTGQGRIKELIYNDDDTFVEGFVIDDILNILPAINLATRIRHADASDFVYYLLESVVGDTSTFTFVTPIVVASAPGIGSLCTFVEDGKELDLLIKDIAMDKNHNAKVTAINYAPARFDATTGPIPPFESNVTTPVDFFQPEPPQLNGDILSDESIMSRNSDGSLITRMIIPLYNVNSSDVTTLVRYRVSGVTQWSRPDILSNFVDKIVLTGLQDSTNYDVHIFYQRLTGSMLISKPLQLNSVFFIGAGGNPSNVEGFKVSINNGIGYFEWLPNTDIDISHYFLRFTGLIEDVLWETSQILADNVFSNRVSFPIQVGTYLIKAVDLTGNESETATTIISSNAGIVNNVVENLIAQPDWTGTKDNAQVEDGCLVLIDNTLVGYYYFDEVDLGEIFESILSSLLQARFKEFVRIRAVDEIRSLERIRGFAGIRIRTVDSIRSLPSVRGVAPSLWSVIIEMSMSSDGVIYTDWTEFVSGTHIFEYIKFRLVLNSYNESITPLVVRAEISIDMPDRYESDEDVHCPVGGATIVYNTVFRNNPSVNITLQNGNVDDKIEYISKTSAGFTIKVYNATTGGYVDRSFDYISAGYGRVS